LITKSHLYEKAVKRFEGTGVNVTTQGRLYLGSYVGADETKNEERIQELAAQLRTYQHFQMDTVFQLTNVCFYHFQLVMVV